MRFADKNVIFNSFENVSLLNRLGSLFRFHYCITTNTE